MHDSMFLRRGKSLVWWNRFDAPFDVREALDEVGLYHGKIDTIRHGGEEKKLPVIALVSKVQGEDEHIDGYWRVVMRNPDAPKAVFVAKKLFRSSYEAVQALHIEIPQHLVRVKP